MVRPKRYDEGLRDRLVDAAGHLLAAEGPHALSTRRVVHEAGTTTNALYTLIGGKGELVRAMYLEGFRRLARRMHEVPEGLPPLERLALLGDAYLDNAFANPHLYTVMFERPVPGFTPGDDDRTEALGTLELLMQQVQRCVDAGDLPSAPPAEEQAMALWAISHGVCSLAIAGMLTEPDARALCANASLAMGSGFVLGAAARDEA